MHVHDFQNSLMDQVEPVIDSEAIDTCCIDCQRLAKGMIRNWWLTPQLRVFQTYQTQRLGRMAEDAHTEMI